MAADIDERIRKSAFGENCEQFIGQRVINFDNQVEVVVGLEIPIFQSAENQSKLFVEVKKFDEIIIFFKIRLSIF